MSNDKPNVIVTQHGAIPEDRVVERSQGCWNCRHRETGESVERRWSEHKAVLLAKLRGSGLFTRASISLGRCAVPGGPVGQDKDTGAETNIPDVFIHMKYLCRKWSAASGASLARGTDKADLLPAELRERIDGATRRAPWANDNDPEEN